MISKTLVFHLYKQTKSVLSTFQPKKHTKFTEAFLFYSRFLTQEEVAFSGSKSKPEFMTLICFSLFEKLLRVEIPLPWGPKRVWLLPIFETKSGKIAKCFHFQIQFVILFSRLSLCRFGKYS